MRFPRFDFQSATIDIGRFGQAPIALHASFFFIAFALTFHFWKTWTLAGFGLALIGIAIIFVSILIHEFAHAVFARRYNIPLHGIDINVYGGVVHFGWRPSRVSRDIALTLAGPASNLALAALTGIALLFVLEPHMVKSGCEMIEDGFEWPTGIFGRVLLFATFFNLGLGLMNLLPAFPLDGGWIAYRLLTHRFGTRTAGTIVASAGIVLAALSTLVLLGSLLSGFAIYMPLSFRTNLEALDAARRGEPISV